MTDHFRNIYQHEAHSYDLLVSREDYKGAILPALNAICALAGKNVVEFGAGTGRLTRLLAPNVKNIFAFDISYHMLSFAKSSPSDVVVCVGDNREMPIKSGVSDIVIAGWSFGHTVGWYPHTWQSNVDLALQEMFRILKHTGTAIILETLGTGNTKPAPPNAGLQQYYEYLEATHGFSSSWIRTDYQFNSIEESDRLTRFFFGDELANKVLEKSLTILPECTGVWWKKP